VPFYDPYYKDLRFTTICAVWCSASPDDLKGLFLDKAFDALDEKTKQNKFRNLAVRHSKRDPNH